MRTEDPNAHGTAEEIEDLRRRLEQSLARERELQAAVDEANAARAESEAESGATARLLNSVLESMNHGVAVYGADDRLVVHNRRFAEMYGLRPEDIRPGAGRAEVIDLVVRRNWPGMVEQAAPYFVTDDAGGPVEIPLPNGSIHERAVLMRPDGGCVISHTDITERRRVEADIREQRAILQDAFDNVAQGLAAYDENARVITWNRKYQDFLILEDHQIYRGCPVWELVMLHAERGTYGPGERRELEERVRARIAQLMSGQIVRFDYTNANGISMEAVSAPRPQGGFVVTYADITDRKLAEAEIIRARDEAEAANRAKSSFLAAMSHEIRTPMNGVLGLIEVLQQSELTDDQRLLTETVSESATALLRIIDDILDFSKIEAGRMELESVPVPLRRTVESVLDTVAAAAEAKGLDLTMDMAEDLPDTVLGDPVRIRQILLNMLGNGVKFTEQGSVAVRVKGNPLPDGGKRLPVEFAVVDTGIGISAEHQALLFMPFSQAESTTTRRFGGTGLGLSISRRLVELMDGEIGVTSTEGEGSTFRFTIPFEPMASEVAERPEPIDLTGDATVVFSDRTALSRSVMKELFGCGAGIDFAATPDALAEKLEAADRETVLLVDDRMPAADISWLLERHTGRRAVLLRGASTSPLAGDLVAGFAATVTRPVHRGPLLKAVGAVLGRASPELPAVAVEPAPVPAPAAGPLPDSPRILVAEDTAINRFVIDRQLTGLGYRADYAVNGREAFELWQGNSYDLVLTDCHMPVVDGFELTRLVRDAEAEAGNGRIPIIALTANALAGEAERCIGAGMDDFLAKPVTVRQMGEKLAHWLDPAAR